MHPLIEAPTTGVGLFHSRASGFSLHLCTYVLLDEHGNDAAELDQVAVIRVTALNGERFRLRDRNDIRRFLQAIGRLTDEVTP